MSYVSRIQNNNSRLITVLIAPETVPSKNIQLAQVKFGTPVDFKEDGHEILVTSIEDATYVGAPSQAIDDAWTQLLWGRYFSISESEAKELWGNDYEAYWDHDKSGYTAGFDMFHQLHCLNQIRQALHRDYYPETAIHGEVKKRGRTCAKILGKYLEHCINHIRQSLMCWGSTAVTPIKFFPGYGHGYVKSDAMHTCRKFEPIREFVSERFNGSLHVPRPNGYKDHFDHAY
ncbi:hypothetical protein BKA65DRAFT_399045 [Rhexocercosporidium sp. MPI-PUGE-AT-0058]|nr:hypothetical protein BKA65DRAFT_399045 [Rhexocercosporidium sp. MPI-PUGE-AT-0058]